MNPSKIAIFLSCIFAFSLLNSMQLDPEYPSLYTEYKDLIIHRDHYIEKLMEQGMSQSHAEQRYHEMLGKKAEELTSHRSWCSTTH